MYLSASFPQLSCKKKEKKRQNLYDKLIDKGLAFSSEGGGSQIYWGGHNFLERKIGEVIKFWMT